MPRGGARPGAGRPKGVKSKGTLEKEEARKLLRALVTARLGPLVESQISNAMGIKYLVVREKKTGKFVRVPKNAAESLNPNEEIIEVWEKDPSIQAFTDLLDRTVDKATQAVNLNANLTGTLDIVKRLESGRKRVADARASKS